MEFPLVTIPNTEVRSLVSAIVNQEFRIFVALCDSQYHIEH